MLDRIYHELRKSREFREVKSVGARVPLVKFLLHSNVVDYYAEAIDFEFDIQCNCVAGIYNSFLLGGLVK